MMPGTAQTRCADLADVNSVLVERDFSLVSTTRCAQFFVMSTAPTSSPVLQCPTPLAHRTEITVGHGGGGRLTQDLIEQIFRPAFANAPLEAQHDGAVFSAGGTRLAFTTDSHVVSPLFFPGGDIGELAVNGTVNDLAMCGARPQWLSAGFILEEGLPMATLQRVVDSM